MRSLLVSFFLCFSSLGVTASAFGGTYVNFDVSPNGGLPTAINKWGTVAGYYSTPTNGYNGFIYQMSTGKLTTFTVPGVSRTYALGINTSGWVVGYFDDKAGVHHGFLRNPKYTTLDAPGAGTLNAQGTQALSINDVGQIAGVYFDANSVEHGFIRDAAGNYTTFDVPGGTAVNSASLNQNGQIAGSYTSPTGGGNLILGYLRDSSGNFTTLNVANSIGTYVDGFNSGGQVTGHYFATVTDIQQFVADEFGTITTFAITGYTSTAGLDDNENIVGAYTSGATFRGWKRNAAAVVSSFKDPDAGVGGTTPTCVSSNGKVAGYYRDSTGVSHNFLLLN